MDKIIFEWKKLIIKRKHVAMVICLLMLFLLLFSCSNNTIIKEDDNLTDEKMKSPCYSMKFMMNNLNDLIASSNLCTNQWKEDVDDYNSRLEAYTKLLKKTELKNHEQIKIQEQLFIDLIELVEVQNYQTLGNVEKTFFEYKKHYENRCLVEYEYNFSEDINDEENN